jgi:hypothetical protein
VDSAARSQNPYAEPVLQLVIDLLAFVLFILDVSRVDSGFHCLFLEARIAFVEKTPLSGPCTILNKFGYQFFEFNDFTLPLLLS